MPEIPKEIIRFIKEHHVMTLSTFDGSKPYCANLFYTYSAELGGFIYTSSHETVHAKHCLKNNDVAASIVVETKVVGKVRGLQICGKSMPITSLQESKAKRAYINKFPYAIIASLELWLFQPTFLKLTDNRLGFGKKLIWNSDEKC